MLTLKHTTSNILTAVSMNIKKIKEKNIYNDTKICFFHKITLHLQIFLAKCFTALEKCTCYLIKKT